MAERGRCHFAGHACVVDVDTNGQHVSVLSGRRWCRHRGPAKPDRGHGRRHGGDEPRARHVTTRALSKQSAGHRCECASRPGLAGRRSRGSSAGCGLQWTAATDLRPPLAGTGTCRDVRGAHHHGCHRACAHEGAGWRPFRPLVSGHGRGAPEYRRTARRWCTPDWTFATSTSMGARSMTTCWRSVTWGGSPIRHNPVTTFLCAQSSEVAATNL